MNPELRLLIDSIAAAESELMLAHDNLDSAQHELALVRTRLEKTGCLVRNRRKKRRRSRSP